VVEKSTAFTGYSTKKTSQKYYLRFVYQPIFKCLTLVKEALIEIGCVVTSLVAWLVVTRVHCGQTVHPWPIVTMEY